jgi:putative transposase
MCTFQRRQHFADFSVGEQVTAQLLRTAVRYDAELVAHCFMPDHLHVLVEGKSEQANSRKFADVFRQVSGFHFRKSEKGRLWQDGYYDHVLRDEEATLPVVRYIVLNPVRAGLCAEASAYPLLGSTGYEMPQLVTAVDWYPPWRATHSALG